MSVDTLKIVATLLLFCCTHAYLFLTNKGSCYVISTRNLRCDFLVFDGDCVHQPFFKTQVSGVSYCIEMCLFINSLIFFPTTLSVYFACCQWAPDITCTISVL